MGRILFCLVLSLFLCISCTSVDERSFFNFPVSDIGTDVPHRNLDVGNDTLAGIMASDCIVRDTVIIALSRTGYLFSISGLDGELSGEYCRRGRAWNEPLSGLPLSETYFMDGDLCADVYSFMDMKLFVWNITRSISEGRDIYEDIIQFKDEDEARLKPWMSLYRLDEDRIIVYNSMQSGYGDGLVGVPDYQIYDLDTGTLQREYDLFNVVEKDTEDPVLSPSVFLTNVDCIKPDRSRIAFGMYFMPVFCILDIESGEAEGYRLKGHGGLDLQEAHRHFVDIQADDEYIYALYSGEVMFNDEGTDVPDMLYVMDWDGNLLCRYDMSRRFSGLSLDGHKLYLTHYEGAVAVVDTDMIKRDLQQ